MLALSHFQENLPQLEIHEWALQDKWLQHRTIKFSGSNQYVFQRFISKWIDEVVLLFASNHIAEYCTKHIYIYYYDKKSNYKEEITQQLDMKELEED